MAEIISTNNNAAPVATVIPFPIQRQRLRLIGGTHAQAEPGAVKVVIGGHAEYWLSPSEARFWARTLVQLATTAERLGVERG